MINNCRLLFPLLSGKVINFLPLHYNILLLYASFLQIGGGNSHIRDSRRQIHASKRKREDTTNMVM